MKKTLSLVLSLMMILATLTALPFTAHATEIGTVKLSYYFDDGDKIKYSPTLLADCGYNISSVSWEDQNGQPFSNDQIYASRNEEYTMTVMLSAETGKEFNDSNIAVWFNGVLLSGGGSSLSENKYRVTSMGYALEVQVTFRYVYVTSQGAGDELWKTAGRNSGFHIKDEVIKFTAGEKDANCHFDHWEDVNNCLNLNFPNNTPTQGMMGTEKATLYAVYVPHTFNEGVVTKEPTVTEEGVKTYTCYKCGVKKEEPIEKLPAETPEKLTNTLTAKGKTVTVKKAVVKKKNVAVKRSKAITVKNAKGKVTYKKSKGNKKITVSSAGKITVKKGLKKGTYKVKIKVTAAGNATYKAATKTVTVKIVIK